MIWRVGDGDVVSVLASTDSRHGLFEAGETVVVGVSGGADSVALLHALVTYAGQRNLGLHVAHLDHRLRPDSPEDANHVAGLATAWGLPMHLATADVGSLARSRRRGLEEAGRYARYAFLGRLAGSLGAAKVAVGHTADDHAETVLMNLVRGTGLDGLAAMRPVSAFPVDLDSDHRAVSDPELGPTLRLVRPLLAVRRVEILAHVARHGLAVREDPSNHDPRYLRNRLRHEVVPAMEALNPRLVESLARLATSAADDLSFLESAAAEAWDRLVRVADDRLSLDRGDWEALPVALQRRLARRMAGHFGLERRVDWQAVETLRRTWAGVPTPAGSLPGGLKALSSAHTLTLVVDDKGVDLPGPALAPRPMAVTGDTPLPGGWTLHVELRERRADDGPTGRWHCHLDADQVGDLFSIRGRRPGDRLAPLGMGGRHRSVQDVLLDARIPAGLRDTWPLVLDGDTILWVVGVAQSELGRIGPATVRVLDLVATPPPDLGWPS